MSEETGAGVSVGRSVERNTERSTGGPDTPHAQNIDDVLTHQQSDARTGLTAAEAERRRRQYGVNVLREGSRRNPWRILLDQFTDVMILILIVAAILAGVLGELADTIAIIAILLLNATLGFTQEMRAEKALTAMRQLAAPKTRVRRAGQVLELPSAELVPGDIVMLEAGNMIPADLRLLETAQLSIDESPLTGESMPVSKDANNVCDAESSLGDRHNMAFKGTLVANGRAEGVVIATGMQTQLGLIATLLEEAEQTRTPLQKRLAVFGRWLALITVVICILVFVTGLMRQEPPLLMLLTAVSLAVAAIPESLPAVVTIALALGAYRLVQHQALMRKLSSVESLGSVTWICSDKTGTLTENRMQVVAVTTTTGTAKPEADADNVATPLYQVLALCNDVVLQNHIPQGDPTEVALFNAAEAAGFAKAGLQLTLPRAGELPFESNRMRMTTLHAHQGKFIAATKGAPEAVISRCSSQLTTAGAMPMDVAHWQQQASALAADGMRVMAIAQRIWPALPALDNADAVETDMQFLGLVGLQDPPRAEAADAIATCRTAGITPVMITGDHPSTALAIARHIGMATAESKVLTGRELADMDDEQLHAVIRHVHVYARTDPAQKIRIVRALQDLGELVAMTGDGVNDAPALKQADIGVAMGRGGTDVARETADMVLLDDNFATVVAAIRGGRHIYDNIRRFIRYVLTTNLAEVLLIFLAPLLGMPLPLLPLHILWVNLVTDGLPGLALTVERPEPHLMQRPPRPPRETLFANGLWQHILWVGLLMSALMLGLQSFALEHYPDNWQTMVFTALTMTQLAHVVAIRSDSEPLWRIGLTSNMPLLLTIIVTVALQLALVYVPFLRDIFSTSPLGLGELGLCLGCAIIIYLAVEAEKWFNRHGFLYKKH